MDSLAPVRVLVLENQEFFAKVWRKLAFRKAPFPTDRESTSFSNEVLCNMNPGIPMLGLEAIECLHEHHIQAGVVSFKCAHEVIPVCLYENILDFKYGLE
jgi:hypothetical protein